MTKYGLALDEGRRTLDQQAGHIDAIRNRAATLLGFAILVASVLGGVATGDDAPFGVYTWIAIPAFAGTVLLTLAVFWPRALWSGQDPKVLVRWVKNEGWTEDLAEKGVALRMSKQFASNKKVMEQLNLLCTAGLVTLLIETAALILDLRSH